MHDPDHMPTIEIRDLVADAVHDAVCELTQTDGVGACFMYAVGALFALMHADPDRRYTPQAGGLAILVDPPDGYFTFDPSQDGMLRGEYHCWLASPTGDPIGATEHGALKYSGGILVDLTSRNWRELHSRVIQVDGDPVAVAGDVFAYTPAARMPWRVPDPPRYVWCDATVAPAHYSVDIACTQRMLQLFRAKHVEMLRLHQLVRDGLTKRSTNAEAQKSVQGP